jgi:hypothetical protein
MAQRDSDEFLRTLRSAIGKWKQEQLLDVIQDAQDTRKLNDYLKLTGLAYQMLKKYIETQGKSPVDPLLETILESIGSLDTLTIEEQILVEDALTHDLLEYPFTYNTKLINSFQTSNILNTNIIPNK